MIDPVLQQFEKAVGDQFAEWLSHASGRACTFIRRAGEAPDLVYSHGNEELLVEVTGAYYDGTHAQLLWKSARGLPDAPSHWAGVNPDSNLANAVIAQLQRKSQNRYGSNVVLLIEVPPGITRLSSLAALLKDRIPSGIPFAGAYVVGTFPKENDLGGLYQVFPLKELAY